MGLQLVFNPFTGTFDWVSAAAVEVLRAPFTFASGSIIVQVVEAGSFLDGAILVIDVPFDDPAATIKVGTTTLDSVVFGVTDNAPFAANQYANQEMTSFPIDDILQLIVSPAGSTQGSGTLLYRYRR
jgi:hypothetical protein